MLKQKLREFIPTRCTLKEMLKEVSPSSWNERMLAGNLKPNENIKFSNKGKYMDKYKKILILILAYNSTLYFLMDLRDKCIKI